MTTTAEAFQAGIDAVVADNGLNKNGFRDAIRTVITSGLSNAETTAWIDAMIAEYNRLGITGVNYSSWRNRMITDPVAARELFDALAISINALPESVEPITRAQLMDLRDDRDMINDALDRADVLIAAEPSGTVGRLIKDVLRTGKQQLRQYKEDVRAQIQNLTGDPDS